MSSSTQKLMHVGVGLNLDNALGFIHGTGIPGSAGGNPDLVNAGSLYVNDTDATLWKKILNGVGSDKWREISYGNSPKGLNNFTSISVLDSFPTSEAGIAKWVIEITLNADKSRKYVAEVTAVHNGSVGTDATDVDFNEFGILTLGDDIPGLTITSDLTGTGSNQIIQLLIGATQAIDAVVRRLNFGERTSSTSPLDLTTVPHDISSSLLSAASPGDPILFFVPSRSFRVPANFANSKAVAMSAGTESTVFTIVKSSAPSYTDANVGTLTFAAGSKVGTFSVSPSVDFLAGDVLKIMAPSSPDPDVDLKNICVTIQSNYM